MTIGQIIDGVAVSVRTGLLLCRAGLGCEAPTVAAATRRMISSLAEEAVID